MRVGVCCQVSARDSKPFRAILKTHQNTECKLVTYSKCIAAVSFLWRKTQDPWAKNRPFASKLPVLLIGMTSALLQFNMSKSKLGREFHSQKDISSNLTKVASSFRTCLHHNGANYGASYRNKPGWSPQLTLFKHGHKVWGAAQTCLCVWMYKSHKKDASYPVDFLFFLSFIAAHRRKSKR